jgi:hypothetical protein
MVETRFSTVPVPRTNVSEEIAERMRCMQMKD